MGRAAIYKTARQFRKKCDEYFKRCTHKATGEPLPPEKCRPYTLSGLCVHLGITRDTFARYAKQDKFSDTIKAVRLRVENYAEECLFDKNQNVTGVIFNLKNNFGWRDKIEQEVSGKDGGPIETDNKWTIEIVSANAKDADP